MTRVPVFCLAGLLLGDRERCLEARTDDYLTKPVKVKDPLEISTAWS